MVKLGIVGCGAVTARSHLPIFTETDDFSITALADPQTDRARDLASRFEIPKVVADYRDIIDDVDALVLALPHHLHASIGEELLRAGKHVLMEKPLANTIDECDRLIEAADQGKATLAVAQVRRYMIGYRAAKEYLKSGLIGELQNIEAEEGGVYGWPVASDFFFRQEMSGGGVLMDTGAHVIDALLWWLGEIVVTKYADDNMGNVEADCTMQFESKKGAKGILKLSRVRSFDNICIFRGDRADLEIGLFCNQARLIPRGAKSGLLGKFDYSASNGEQTILDLFREQASEWLKFIQGEPANIATARETKNTIRIILDCYAQRQPQKETWQQIKPATVGESVYG